MQRGVGRRERPTHASVETSGPAAGRGASSPAEALTGRWWLNLTATAGCSTFLWARPVRGWDEGRLVIAPLRQSEPNGARGARRQQRWRGRSTRRRSGRWLFPPWRMVRSASGSARLTSESRAAAPREVPFAALFVIPDVPLIPQQKTMGCWYASAQMLIQWRRGRALATLAAHPDPSEVSETMRLHALNDGLNYGHVLSLAQSLGLRPVPPQSMTLAGLERLVVRYGPLWAHGVAHIIVIAGADNKGDRIFVHDPWPPGIGKAEWRSYSHWFISGSAAGSRGTSRDVQASFLHHP